MGVLQELEGLYRTEYQPMVASLTLLAGSRDLAADAVQDAFVAAGTRWREVSQMERPAGLRRTGDTFELLNLGVVCDPAGVITDTLTSEQRARFDDEQAACKTIDWGQ